MRCLDLRIPKIIASGRPKNIRLLTPAPKEMLRVGRQLPPVASAVVGEAVGSFSPPSPIPMGMAVVVLSGVWVGFGVEVAVFL